MSKDLSLILWNKLEEYNEQRRTSNAMRKKDSFKKKGSVFANCKTDSFPFHILLVFCFGCRFS